MATSDLLRPPPPPASEQLNLLDLPAEIRLSILEYVFPPATTTTTTTNLNPPIGFKTCPTTSTHILNPDHPTPTQTLAPLLTCRQLHADAHLLAFTRTPFLTTSLFTATNIPTRLALLHNKQIRAIRSLTFVADARHFRKLVDWQHQPFNHPDLHLDTLTLVLHRSSFWHYLYDFTSDLVKLLRNLEGLKRLVFVRNNARVKGSFHAWYNRLVGLIMKVDHHERYIKTPCCPEKVWWSWKFDSVAQVIVLEALPAKKWVEEEVYMGLMKPLVEELRVSVEAEEWNPDPRSRNGA
ncbi:hypothetical protein B0A50_06812 [Salinomyces thailandicus]|uniref:Uncharacterized protein n=1 Tax=Salinomyces thailandicus TaxID=706561 RepID=A0A4U0TR53_9PEZI|nr:hypothetical protein B0A50_06812 [Salinomyces thailandica]